MKSHSVYVSGKHAGIRGQQAAGIGPHVAVLAVVEEHPPLRRPEQSELCSLQEDHHAEQLGLEPMPHVHGTVSVLHLTYLELYVVPGWECQCGQLFLSVPVCVSVFAL